MVAAAALRLRRAVAWVEDRGENLTASFHGHQQRYEVRAAFDADGRILGLSADIDCDIGAYSAYAFTSAVEPLMASASCRASTRSRPTGPGAGPSPPTRPRPLPTAGCPVRSTSWSWSGSWRRPPGRWPGPARVRRRNMITRRVPLHRRQRHHLRRGQLLASLDFAERRVTAGGWHARQDRCRPRGGAPGSATSCFSERTGYGTPAHSQRRMRIAPGFDTAEVRMDPTGEVIVTTGTWATARATRPRSRRSSRTSSAWIPGGRLRQGDTDLAAYGWGTFASRSIVIGGGAARRAADQVADQLRAVAAAGWGQPGRNRTGRGAARIRGDRTPSIPIGELPRSPTSRPHLLPKELRYGPEARAVVRPARHVLQRLPRAMVVERRGHLPDPAAAYLGWRTAGW